jgi:hypothetical protein
MYDRRHLFVELPPNVGGMPLWATFRPYPQQLFWTPFQPWDSPLGFSSYNALQITLNKRFSHGINWLANYTFSKSLGNIDSDFQTWGQNGGQPLDRYNLKLEESVTSWDQTHVVKIGLNYELPFGRGRMIGSSMAPLVNAVAGGWNLRYIGNYASGEPLGFGGSGIPNFNNGTNRAELLNTNGQTLRLSDPVVWQGTYLNTSLIKNPRTVLGRYAFGNAPRLVSQVRTPWRRNEDIARHKNFRPFGERTVKFQLRGELINAFNRHRFDSIDAWPASVTFGKIVGVGGNRQTQVGLRLISKSSSRGAGASITHRGWRHALGEYCGHPGFGGFRAPAGAGLAAVRLSERSRVIESIAKKAGRHRAQVTKNFKEEKLCFRLHSGPDADHM